MIRLQRRSQQIFEGENDDYTRARGEDVQDPARPSAESEEHETKIKNVALSRLTKK